MNLVIIKARNKTRDNIKQVMCRDWPTDMKHETIKDMVTLYARCVKQILKLERSLKHE